MRKHKNSELSLSSDDGVIACGSALAANTTRNIHVVSMVGCKAGKMLDPCSDGRTVDRRGIGRVPGYTKLSYLPRWVGYLPR